MPRFNRRKRPNRPHISSSFNFQRASKVKNTAPRQSFGAPPSLNSCQRTAARRPGPSNIAAVRFGEAVSRPTTQNPQEEKSLKPQFQSPNRHECLVSLKPAQSCGTRFMRLSGGLPQCGGLHRATGDSAAAESPRQSPGEGRFPTRGSCIFRGRRLCFYT